MSLADLFTAILGPLVLMLVFFRVGYRAGKEAERKRWEP